MTNEAQPVISVMSMIRGHHMVRDKLCAMRKLGHGKLEKKGANKGEGVQLSLSHDRIVLVVVIVSCNS